MIHSMHPHIMFVHSGWQVSAMLTMVVWFIGRLLLTYWNWSACKDQLVADCAKILHEVLSGVIMVSIEHGLLHPALSCVSYIHSIPCDIYSKYGPPLESDAERYISADCLISGDITQCYWLSCYLSSEGASYPTVFCQWGCNASAVPCWLHWYPLIITLP